MSGEIHAASVVKEPSAGKDLTFTEVRERQLKKFDEPVRLFEVM